MDGSVTVRESCHCAAFHPAMDYPILREDTFNSPQELSGPAWNIRPSDIVRDGLLFVIEYHNICAVIPHQIVGENIHAQTRGLLDLCLGDIGPDQWIQSGGIGMTGLQCCSAHLIFPDHDAHMHDPDIVLDMEMNTFPDPSCPVAGVNCNQPRAAHAIQECQAMGTDPALLCLEPVKGMIQC